VLQRLFQCTLIGAIGIAPVGTRSMERNLETEVAAIRAVLSEYVTAVERGDIELYARVVDHDPSMVNFGTDVNERIVGWAALKGSMETQFASLKDTRIAVSEVTVSLAPGKEFAWATSMWTFGATMAGQSLTLPVRCSWVLAKRGPRWIIVHFHKSVGTAA